MQLDLGSSKLVRSIYIHSYGALANHRWKKDIYIGDTDQSGDYKTQNTKCFQNGGHSGLTNCSGQGQYLIWVLTSNYEFKATEIEVYSKPDYAQQAAISLDPSAMVSTEYDLSNLLGSSDGTANCYKGEASGGKIVLNLEWPQEIIIQEVAVYG